MEILIVEDDATDAALLVRALAKTRVEHRATLLCDGREALDRLAERADGAGELPDLILLDLKLPGIDGLCVLRELKSNTALAHIPIVMLSSSQQPRDVSTAYEYGVNSYLVKPVRYANTVELAQLLVRYWLHLNRKSPATHRRARHPQVPDRAPLP